MALQIQLQQVFHKTTGQDEKVYKVESKCESLRAIEYNDGRSIRCVFMGGNLVPERFSVSIRKLIRGRQISEQEELVIKEGQFTPTF